MPVILLFTLLLAVFNIKAQSFHIDEKVQQSFEQQLSNKTYQQFCQHLDTRLNPLYQQHDFLKGDISRIYFYCESMYGFHLSSRQRRGFEIWDIKDPVSIIECQREKLRKKHPIDTNPYILNRC